jgi:hypothetical protein
MASLILLLAQLVGGIISDYYWPQAARDRREFPPWQVYASILGVLLVLEWASVSTTGFSAILFLLVAATFFFIVVGAVVLYEMISEWRCRCCWF